MHLNYGPRTCARGKLDYEEIKVAVMIEPDVAEYGGRIGRLGSYQTICRYISHWNLCTVQYRILHLACALSRMCTAVDVNCTGIRRVHLLRGWPNKSTFTQDAT